MVVSDQRKLIFLKRLAIKVSHERFTEAKLLVGLAVPNPLSNDSLYSNPLPLLWRVLYSKSIFYNAYNAYNASVFKINNYSAGGGSLENIQSAAYGAYPEKKIATADKAKAEIFVILNVVYSTLYSYLESVAVGTVGILRVDKVDDSRRFLRPANYRRGILCAWTF